MPTVLGGSHESNKDCMVLPTFLSGCMSYEVACNINAHARVPAYKRPGKGRSSEPDCSSAEGNRPLLSRTFSAV